MSPGEHRAVTIDQPSYMVAMEVRQHDKVDLFRFDTCGLQAFEHLAPSCSTVTRIEENVLPLRADYKAADRRRHRTLGRKTLHLCRIGLSVEKFVGHTLLAFVVLQGYQSEHIDLLHRYPLGVLLLDAGIGSRSAGAGIATRSYCQQRRRSGDHPYCFHKP